MNTPIDNQTIYYIHNLRSAFRCLRGNLMSTKSILRHASALLAASCVIFASAVTAQSACLSPDPAIIPAAIADAVKELPEAIQADFAGYGSPVVASPYREFVSDAQKPWVVGYSNSFSGNAWRAGALASLESSMENYRAKGLVGELIVTDSNGNITTQIQQMRSLIQRGVDLIISIPGSPTAMNDVIEEAFKAGIPVVTLASPVTSPYAINVDVNGYLYARTTALGLATLLGGAGNIVAIQGIPGTSGSELFKSGADSIFASCPDLKVLAELTGEWSNSVAQTALVQWLTSNPAQIDGVWQQGSMFMGTVQALQQAGRKLVPVVIGNPDQNALAFWRDNLPNGFSTVGTANPPGAGMALSLDAGLRVLLGQGLKVSNIVVAPPLIDDAKLKDWVKPEYTLESTGVGEPAPGTWLPVSELDAYFLNPGAIQ